MVISPLISSKCARRLAANCEKESIFTIIPDPLRYETFNRYLLTSCQINYHHHMYFLLVSGESGHGKLKRQLCSFQRGCGRREGTEGPMALPWGVHMQRYFCGSLQAHPATSSWPGFAGNTSRIITRSQTSLLLCRARARERSQSSGADPAQSAWASPCTKLHPSQKGRTSGGREGKGNRKKGLGSWGPARGSSSSVAWAAIILAAAPLTAWAVFVCACPLPVSQAAAPL